LNQLFESHRRRPFGRVAEVVAEEGGEEAGELGVGLGALAAQGVRLIQQLHDHVVFTSIARNVNLTFEHICFSNRRIVRAPHACYQSFDECRRLNPVMKKARVNLFRVWA